MKEIIAINTQTCTANKINNKNGLGIQYGMR